MTDKQHVGRELEAYGKVMHQLFGFLIALHRFHKAGIDKLTKEEQMARATLVQTVARMQRFLQPEDRDKLKRFSLELSKADLSDSDDLIIETILHRHGVM